MSDQDKTDEEVAIAVQQGHSDSFAVITQRYEPKLKRYASKFLKRHSDSEDVIQEIFIKAYRNIQSFDPSRKFSSWIYRIAHNEFINYIKKRRIETVPLFDTDIIIPYYHDYGEDVDREKVKKTLENHLQQLDIKYREPILLYYIEDFSYKEISDILHIPIATVGVRINRGKKLLLDKYKEQQWTKT